MVEETPVEIVDCVGVQCPLPVIKTAQAIQEIEVGQLLELRATDPGVQPDMEAWTRRTKNELVGITKEGDVYRVLIRKV